MTRFNFTEVKLVSLLDSAKELGADVFLPGDGRFGDKFPRDSDHAGLGDCQVNPRKLPHGLSYLAKEAKARGVQFGIWLEPEMVNPTSEFYQLHPDWVIGQPPGEQSHLWIDYVRALYADMDRFATNFPNVTAMRCSGGGLRVDFEALRRFHNDPFAAFTRRPNDCRPTRLDFIRSKRGQIAGRPGS